MITAKKIKKAYDRYAKEYDNGTELQRSLADKLLNAVESDAVKFSRALDIGCGTGYLLEKMGTVPFFWDCPHFLFGCDISFNMLRYAKNKIQAFYIQSDAAYLPFYDSAFDFVVSNAAYQWVLDLRGAFEEVKRVLAPGGKFYFMVFSKNTLWQLQSVCSQMSISSAKFPDKGALLLPLEEAGFKINSIETFSYEKYYKDLWELLSVLKKIGSTSVDNKNISGLNWRSILRQANDLYAVKFGSEKGIPATYEAFLIRADKG